jgi:hypothetical protein
MERSLRETSEAPPVPPQPTPIPVSKGDLDAHLNTLLEARKEFAGRRAEPSDEPPQPQHRSQEQPQDQRMQALWEHLRVNPKLTVWQLKAAFPEGGISSALHATRTMRVLASHQHLTGHPIPKDWSLADAKAVLLAI